MKAYRVIFFRFLIVLIGLVGCPDERFYAAEIVLKRVVLESSYWDGWNVKIDSAFSLSKQMHDVLSKGIALYFKVEFMLTQPRWYWFSRQLVSSSRTYRLSYQPLMQQYRVSFGGLQASFMSCDSALNVIRHIPAWFVVPKDLVRLGETYQVSTRVFLDVSQMPKPFQLNAVNNREWSLVSDWLYFEFTPKN